MNEPPNQDNSKTSGPPRRVLVTGGTGYLGRALIPELIARGHSVVVLVRAGSEAKVPRGARFVLGDPFIAASVGDALADVDTVVHLVGVPKPSPAKAREFEKVDLRSILATVTAVSRVREPKRPHLIYVSVAQPAPVMRMYIAIRAEGEAMIRSLGSDATVLRPWYVLGPGHQWPRLLRPLYAILSWIPATRASAERLGLVTLAQMTAALVRAVEQRPTGLRVVEVPEIRSAVG